MIHSFDQFEFPFGVRPLIVSGTAGAGKTTYIINWLRKRLQEGFQLKDICFISHTTRAVGEMAERLWRSMGLGSEITSRFLSHKHYRKDAPYMGTFHSIAWLLCELNANQRPPRDYLEDLVSLALDKVHYEHVLEKPGQYPDRSDIVKNSKAVLECYHTSRSGSEALGKIINTKFHRNPELKRPSVVWYQTIIREYQKYKIDNKFFDYEDILEYYNRRGRVPSSIQIIIVDEAQDLNPQQFAMLRKMSTSRNLKHIVIAGDDDQAIFEFSGADPKTFIELEGDPYYLEQSNRVPTSVALGANRLLSKISQRRPKIIKPRNHEGKVRELIEASGSLPDFSKGGVILASTREKLRDISRQLYLEGIPHLQRNGDREYPSIPESARKAVNSYTRLQYGHRMSGARIACVLKATNRFPACRRDDFDFASFLGSQFGQDRGYTFWDMRERAQVEFDATESWSRALTELSQPDKRGYYSHKLVQHITRALDNGYDMDCSNLKLSTIHGFKGGESENIYYYTYRSQKAQALAMDNPDLDLRMSFVAITRTLDQLTIIHGKNEATFLKGLFRD